MKTSELKTGSVYAHQTDSYSGPSAILLLDTVMWTEEDIWYTAEDGKRETKRILRKAEKGERAGANNSHGYSRTYRATGFPVLVLKAHHYRFTSLDENTFTGSALEMLNDAKERVSALGVLDTGKAIPTSGKGGQTEVQEASGETQTVRVELELVRPQTIKQEWSEWLEDTRKADVARVELEMQVAARKAENDKTAYDIRDRVTALLEDSEGLSYTRSEERLDMHRPYSRNGISTTYEVSEKTLLRLIEMAERGSTQ